MTWLGCTIGLAIVAFIIAGGIPIFSYILALAGSLGFAPITIILPALLWLYDHGHYRRGSVWKMIAFYLHCGMALLGIFMTIGGTYAVVQSVIDAYKEGTIGSAFSCADNSGST